MADNVVFPGFSYPDDKNKDTGKAIGFTRLPNDWFDVCAEIKSLTELKVVLYVMRHTWGFQLYDKLRMISTDEFMQGRKLGKEKRTDKTQRMDKGTGLSDYGVRDGLAKAVKHGYLEVYIDDKDKARIKKYYGLRMRPRKPDETS